MAGEGGERISVEAATVAGDIRSLLTSILHLEPIQVTHRGVAPHVWVEDLSITGLTLHILWGTPAYAVPTLRQLHQAGHTIVGVVSQPDRRRGRGQQLVASAVKQEALNLNHRCSRQNGSRKILTARRSCQPSRLMRQW